MIRYTSQSECRANCKPGQYAAGHRDLTTGETYWLIFDGITVHRDVAPVRSERYVYTPSGKKRTSKELCGRAFRKHGANKEAFLTMAIALGVKPTTARTMFSHYTVGRYAVAA